MTATLPSPTAEEYETMRQALVEARDQVRDRDRRIASLENELATLRTRLALLEKPASASPSVAPSSGSADEAAGRIADLERQLQDLRSRIALGQAEVTRLIRATVDTRYVPPPGGRVYDGQVWRRESDANGNVIRWVPLGPAVKQGDFRTAGQRDAAIAEAKAALLPLRVRERELVAALDAEKKAAKPAAAPATPTAPVSPPQ